MIEKTNSRRGYTLAAAINTHGCVIAESDRRVRLGVSDIGLSLRITFPDEGGAMSEAQREAVSAVLGTMAQQVKTSFGMASCVTYGTVAFFNDVVGYLIEAPGDGTYTVRSRNSFGFEVDTVITARETPEFVTGCPYRKEKGVLYMAARMQSVLPKEYTDCLESCRDDQPFLAQLYEHLLHNDKMLVAQYFDEDTAYAFLTGHDAEPIGGLEMYMKLGDQRRLQIAFDGKLRLPVQELGRLLDGLDSTKAGELLTRAVEERLKDGRLPEAMQLAYRHLSLIPRELVGTLYREDPKTWLVPLIEDPTLLLSVGLTNSDRHNTAMRDRIRQLIGDEELEALVTQEGKASEVAVFCLSRNHLAKLMKTMVCRQLLRHTRHCELTDSERRAVFNLYLKALGDVEKGLINQMGCASFWKLVGETLLESMEDKEVVYKLRSQLARKLYALHPHAWEIRQMCAGYL